MTEGETFRILATDRPSETHCSRCFIALRPYQIQVEWNNQLFTYHPECVGHSEEPGRDVVVPAAGSAPK